MELPGDCLHATFIFIISCVFLSLFAGALCLGLSFVSRPLILTNARAWKPQVLAENAALKTAAAKQAYRIDHLVRMLSEEEAKNR